MCEWPKTTASASGNARRSRASRPRAGPASWITAIRAPPASISVRSGSRARRAASSTLPCTATSSRQRPAISSNAASPEKSPAWITRSAARRRSTHRSGSRRLPRGRWVSASTRDRRHAQSSARNAIRSAPSSSGSSKAAKWPPRSNSVQRRRSASVALGPLARRADDLGREVGDRGRHLDPLPGRQPPAVARLGRVQAHRRGDRPGRPVDGEEVAELVLGEAPLDLAVAVRPAPVLVDQPGGEPGRRVVQARRERVGRGALGEQVKALAAAASAAPPARRRPRPRSSAGRSRSAGSGSTPGGVQVQRGDGRPGRRTPSGRR